MKNTRREFLAATGAVGAAGLAGCTGQLTSEGAAFEATEATLSANVQNETGYSHYRTVEDVQTREFSRFGISRTVEVTSVISEYDRAIELGFLGTRIQAAVFATLSTPTITILGRDFNPIADMDTVAIAEMIQDRYDNIRNVQEDASFETEVAGETTAVTRFTADARLVEIGQGIEIYLYVSEPVELGEDFVVTLAGHPTAFGRNESTVRTLMGGVEHSGE
ncbi:DUF6517 family protein [Natronomonas sp.]|uniref:DUF6517 family protein n=1 Tax=Natronomonas sp. TaxID=2184060 RepID=UPI002FC35164